MIDDKAPSRRLPRHLTKVSYILAKTDKKRLMAAAKRAGCSMSEVITRALDPVLNPHRQEAA